MAEPATPGTVPDDELLARVRGGDSGALERLLERYQGPLLRFSMRMCRNTADAEDVLQESLLAAARGLPEFRGDSSLSSWLYSIARSFCIKQRRGLAAKARRSATVGDDEARVLPDEHDVPEQSVANHELSTAFDTALRELPEDYREVLLLRDVEGLTAPEVAESLSLNVPQVKSRLHRARVALRAQLTPLLAELQNPVPNPGCPEIVETFSQFLEGEISPDLCERMQAHVESCEHCRGTCDSLKRTLAMCHAVPAPVVPKGIQDAVRAAILQFRP